MKFWAKILFLFKILVVLTAAKFILDYIRDYDIIRLLFSIAPEYLLASLALSVVGLVSLSANLYIISQGKISFLDCLLIEFYTQMMNLGVVSSFFSLPKIAWIRERVGSAKESARIFVTQSAFGVFARASLLIIGASAVFGRWEILVLALALAAALMLVGKVRKFILRACRMDVGVLIRVLLISMAMVFCSSASYLVLIAGLTSQQPSLAAILLSDQVSYLSGFFSPIPAGLGVREVAFTETTSFFGLEKEVGFSAAIISRTTLILAQIAIGAVVLARKHVLRSS